MARSTGKNSPSVNKNMYVVAITCSETDVDFIDWLNEDGDSLSSPSVFNSTVDIEEAMTRYHNNRVSSNDGEESGYHFAVVNLTVECR